MMNLRPYHANDLAPVLNFVGRCLHHDDFKNYHPGDIIHWMSNGQRGKDLDKHFWLYEKAGEIFAFAELPPAKWASYSLLIHPDHRGGDLEKELLNECYGVMQTQMKKEQTEKDSILVNVAVSGRARRACLSELGYSVKESSTVVDIRSLDRPIPDLVLPTGFQIRSVAGEHEADEIAEAHRSAFDSNWTTEDYLDVMRTSGFDIERELVVVAPDGCFAAFLIYWLDPVSKSGLFEPVGCHKDFQRKGLTKALMFEGMRHMVVSGMKVALVGHNSDNTVANKLYASVGFREHFKTLDYVKGV